MKPTFEVLDLDPLRQKRFGDESCSFSFTEQDTDTNCVLETTINKSKHK